MMRCVGTGTLGTGTGVGRPFEMSVMTSLKVSENFPNIRPKSDALQLPTRASTMDVKEMDEAFEELGLATVDRASVNKALDAQRNGGVDSVAMRSPERSDSDDSDACE